MEKKRAARHLQEIAEPPNAPQIDGHFERHAPRDRFDLTRTDVSSHVRQAIANREPIEAIVLTADIRRSSAMMKESVDLLQFATVLGDFVGEFRTVLSYHNGWFDKFTGDGFICYWLVENSFASHMETVLTFSATVMEHFRRYYQPAFIANLRNIPSGIGLSIGIDAGHCQVAPIAGDLTLLGQPIVGAVRMADAARNPYQLLMNAHPGNRINDGATDKTHKLAGGLNYRVANLRVPTKEYPAGQETFSISFLKGDKNLFA
jgi:class 3 adenylate cyclase